MLTAKGWRWWVPRLLSGAVGLILLTSGILKSMDMEIFIRQIRDYGIISNHALLVLSSWTIIVVEYSLGTALLVSYRPKLTTSLAALLLLIFLGATVWAWLTGVTEDCGCFGTWIKRTPGEAAIEDLVLLVALSIALAIRRPLAEPRKYAGSWAVIAACIAGLILPFLSGDPISRITRPISESIDIKRDLMTIKGLEHLGLKHGDYLLLIMSTDCQHCLEAVEKFNIWLEGTNPPDLTGISANNKEQLDTFIKAYQPAFPIVQIQEDAFWRLLGEGDIPRLILVRDQRILKVWDEKIPDIHSVKEALH
jgi:uncharacterized membrane protein YphA (DoxX/SURF4 family)